jgi:hypothetical protein
MLLSGSLRLALGPRPTFGFINLICGMIGGSAEARGQVAVFSVDTFPDKEFAGNFFGSSLQPRLALNQTFDGFAFLTGHLGLLLGRANSKKYNSFRMVELYVFERTR